METEASAMNCISINPDHQLICVGTTAGRIEAWDPRYSTFLYFKVSRLILLWPPNEKCTIKRVFLWLSPWLLLSKERFQGSGTITYPHRLKNFLSIMHFCRVVDPYSFFPDPDPEFDVGDQYGSGSGSNSIRIQGFNDQKLKKNYSWKFFFIFFYIKNCNLPIPRPP